MIACIACQLVSLLPLVGGCCTTLAMLRLRRRGKKTKK